MVRKMCVLAVAFFFVNIYAQTIRDSMDIGDNTIKWRVYDAPSPVLAFALSGTQLWYALETGVVLLDIKTGQERQYPTLGDVSAENVKTIALDGKGGVWLGNAEGASLYKDSKFTLFTESNGLPGTVVNKIFCLGGDAWVGTEKGLARYRGGVWTVYTTKDGLCGNRINGITADDGGTVYFATNKGVAVFSGSQWKKHDTKSGMSSSNVKAIAFDPRKGHLWVSVGEQDVNCYDGKEWNTFMDIQPGITCILTDTQSRIWFGSPTGAIKYNGFEWINDPAKIGFPASQINDVYRDNKGDLYFAIETGVLHMTNPYPY